MLIILVTNGNYNIRMVMLTILTCCCYVRAFVYNNHYTYIYIYTYIICICIYIYKYIHTCVHEGESWLRASGVNTDGAAAKAMNFDGLGKKARPGTFGEDKRCRKQKSESIPQSSRTCACAGSQHIVCVCVSSTLK